MDERSKRDPLRRGQQGGKCRARRSPHQLDEEADPISPLLLRRAEDRHESSQCDGTGITPVSTADLPIHDGRADALFGWPVRGFETNDSQEGEEPVAIAVEMVAKQSVGFVSGRPVEVSGYRVTLAEALDIWTWAW